MCIRDSLKTEFDIRNEDIFSIAGPLDLTVLMKVYGLEGFEKHKSGKYVPAPVPQFQTDKNIFEAVSYTHLASAKKVSEKRDPSCAAIASREAGQLFGLELLAENICHRCV